VAFLATDVVAVLDRLDAAQIETWLHGGWGVESLVGEPSRPHDDMDLIVQVNDVQEMRDVLAGVGFGLVRGMPDSNFVLRDDRGREVDVHPVRFDAEGNGIYRMEDGEDWVFPANGFAGIGTVAGRAVKCLTPEVEMLCHSTGYEPGETDFRDMGLLYERFGTPFLPPYDRMRRTKAG
jgi:lincosamide nucleotidyltransferase A/C/D/E